MDRRKILAAGAVAPVLAVPAITHAQTRVRWRMPGSFPKSLDTLAPRFSLWRLAAAACAR